MSATATSFNSRVLEKGDYYMKTLYLVHRASLLPSFNRWHLPKIRFYHLLRLGTFGAKCKAPQKTTNVTFEWLLVWFSKYSGQVNKKPVLFSFIQFRIRSNITFNVAILIAALRIRYHLHFRFITCKYKSVDFIVCFFFSLGLL